MESSRGSSPSLSPGSLSPSPRADENGARARPLLLNEDIRGPLLLGEGSRADRPLLRGRSHNMLTVTHRPLPTNSGSVCQRVVIFSQIKHFSSSPTPSCCSPWQTFTSEACIVPELGQWQESFQVSKPHFFSSWPLLTSIH